MMKIKFLGVGTAFSKVDFVSNLLVEYADKIFMIDFGNKITTSLNQKKCPLDKINAVIVTHLHADHIGGLEELALYTKLKGLPKPYIVTSPVLLDQLWEHSLKGGLEYIEAKGEHGKRMSLDDYFVPISAEPNKWLNLPFLQELDIQFVPSIHVKNMYTYGLLIKKENKKILFFSGDTKFNLDYIQKYGSIADLILHDCQIKDNPPENELGVHSTLNQLLTLSKKLREKMCLYHHDAGIELPDLKDSFVSFIKTNTFFEF